MKPRRLATLCAVLLVAPGCYSYSPTGFQTVAPGIDVRANLTTEKSFELERELGERRTVLEGEVLEADPSSFLLSVPWTYRDPRLGQTALRQRIRLQESEVIQVEIRSLDRGRSALLFGALGAVGGFILYQIFGPDDAGGTIRPGPPNGEV